jgi:hypothetical protein
VTVRSSVNVTWLSLSLMSVIVTCADSVSVDRELSAGLIGVCMLTATEIVLLSDFFLFSSLPLPSMVSVPILCVVLCLCTDECVWCGPKTPVMRSSCLGVKLLMQGLSSRTCASSVICLVRMSKWLGSLVLRSSLLPETVARILGAL